MDPTPETLRIIARDLGISVPDERLAAAAETHARFRTKLNELRRLKLPFLEPIEPAHARRWIERGGQSQGWATSENK